MWVQFRQKVTQVLWDKQRQLTLQVNQIVNGLFAQFNWIKWTYQRTGRLISTNTLQKLHAWLVRCAHKHRSLTISISVRET